MEILWPILGICVLVCFVFFILAQHWQRVLRHQNGTIRRLNERVRTLEEVDDPEFRRRLGESAPPPLEQIFTFSFRLSEQFWRETLHTTEENSSFIRAFGSFLGSVKIERWRGHSVATITEVLPDRRSAVWQSRTLDCFLDAQSGPDKLTLWELPLARIGRSNERPASLELLLKEKSVELCAHLFAMPGSNGHSNISGTNEIVFFRVPLDSTELSEFRSDDPLENADRPESPLNQAFWRTFYSHRDEDVGFEWQLSVLDLNKKGEWDRWKILEPEVDHSSQNVPQKRS
ncbi:MAG TPA: hypothetical protein VN861_03695 [Candidatus Acidoferrales bacterium]|nr:hypothetical protein [Candidatus Acidoferrales bacterium]